MKIVEHIRAFVTRAWRLVLTLLIFALIVDSLLHDADTALRLLIFLPFAFLLLDYAAFELRWSDTEEGKRESGYHPNLRMPGIGAVLALSYLVFSQLDIRLLSGADSSGKQRSDALEATADSVTQFSSASDPVVIVSETVFALAVFAFIIFAIVKIVRED
ncbi:MAG: hypothetical protein FJ215_00610 [Ignavibacteria bacterium]|nr:hypothetical protein [Ignavibacteria bacterium]